MNRQQNTEHMMFLLPTLADLHANDSMIAYNKPGATDSPLGDTANELTFPYLRDSDEQSLVDSPTELLKHQHGGLGKFDFKAKIDILNKPYMDVKKGDRYHLRFEPDTGTSLFVNDKLFRTTKGRDFSRVYFEIWLGNRPLSSSLKKQLRTPIERK